MPAHHSLAPGRSADSRDRHALDRLLGAPALGVASRTPLDPERLTLSVLIAVYNEAGTIEDVVDLVRASPVRTEIVVVDDGSTDGSAELLDALYEEGAIDRLHRQPVNRGKGAAIRQALTMSTGDVVIVQDADLEYDPADWPQLLAPIVDGRADACFGSRFLGGPHRVLYYWHAVGNRVLTTLSNMLTNLNLTDMETCYKAMRGDVARALAPVLRADRFGFEPEITARLAQLGARVFEVPVSYSGRTYAEGKKIDWRDGVAAIWHIVRSNLLAPRATPAMLVRALAREAPRERATTLDVARPVAVSVEPRARRDRSDVPAIGDSGVAGAP